LCIFCRVEEARKKLPEWYEVLRGGEWQVMRHSHLTSWHKVLRNGEIFAEVQVKVDFPDENTMCEELIIDRQNWMVNNEGIVQNFLHNVLTLKIGGVRRCECKQKCWRKC
jgi:hypothetical protein